MLILCVRERVSGRISLHVFFSDRFADNWSLFDPEATRFIKFVSKKAAVLPSVSGWVMCEALIYFLRIFRKS